MRISPTKCLCAIKYDPLQMIQPNVMSQRRFKNINRSTHFAILLLHLICESGAIGAVWVLLLRTTLPVLVALPFLVLMSAFLYSWIKPIKPKIRGIIFRKRQIGTEPKTKGNISPNRVHNYRAGLTLLPLYSFCGGYAVVQQRTTKERDGISRPGIPSPQHKWHLCR